MAYTFRIDAVLGFQQWAIVIIVRNFLKISLVQTQTG